MIHHAAHLCAAHKRDDISTTVFHCYCKFINIFINSIELVEFILQRIQTYPKKNCKLRI